MQVSHNPDIYHGARTRSNFMHVDGQIVKKFSLAAQGNLIPESSVTILFKASELPQSPLKRIEVRNFGGEVEDAIEEAEITQLVREAVNGLGVVAIRIKAPSEETRKLRVPYDVQFVYDEQLREPRDRHAATL